jgi:Phage capsid family
MVIKTPIPAISLGSGLSDPRIAAITETLQNIGVFDRILSDGAFIGLPLSQPQARVSTIAVVGSDVSEGAGIPLVQLSISSMALERCTAAAIVVATKELLRDKSAAAQALINREISRAVIAATDQTFLAAMAAGAQGFVGTGGTAENILDDLEQLVESVSGTAQSQYYFVARPLALQRIAFKASTTGARAFPSVSLHGGEIGDAVFLPSDYLPEGSPDDVVAMLIDASGIGADAARMELKESDRTVVQMDSAPTVHSVTPTHADMVSMYQTNAIALRAVRRWGFRKLRPDCVAMLLGDKKWPP